VEAVAAWVAAWVTDERQNAPGVSFNCAALRACSSGCLQGRMIVRNGTVTKCSIATIHNLPLQSV
jgi:hypothetical protein